MSKYAGAAWNSIMEEETKESLARLYLDLLDDYRNLKEELEYKDDNPQQS